MLLAAALLALAQPEPQPAPPTASDTAEVGALARQSRLVPLADNAVAYIPASASDHPPLLVLLHGAGRDRLNMIQRFEADADKRGIILLAPTSKGATWDAIAVAMTPMTFDSPLQLKQGHRFTRSRDSDRVEAAIANLAKIVPVDRAHTVLAGFSDGATFALAMGMERSHQFAAVVAWSPGIAIESEGTARGRRVFVSHGRQDPLLQFEVTCGEIVPLIKSEGANVSFFAFDGVHEVPQAAKDAFLDAAFGSIPGAPPHPLPAEPPLCPCNAGGSEALGVVGEPTGYRRSPVMVEGIQKRCGSGN
jgi:predicted esterase